MMSSRKPRSGYPGPTAITGSMTLYVYILASKPQGTLYVGVTNDLIRRVIEHKNGEIPGFTKRYKVKRLVYYEPFEDYQAAIAREKKLKRWRRDWKRSLIEETNRHWADLFPAIAPGFTVGPGSDANASVRDDNF
ncbi:MAG TPA: GIY-YIG nuclease family protein [Micropepsaceae bacterium]|nr:GIY-YIG nuclease family protein [Micropepsaceae bacterium]